MRLAIVLPAVVMAAVLSGCNQAPVRSLDAYCKRLESDRTLLARVASPDQLKSTVDAMHKVDAAAPEQIRDQWHRVALLVDEAATADLANPATVSKLREQLTASDKAVKEIVAFTKNNCELDLTETVATAATPGASTPPQTTGPGTLPPTVAKP